MSTHKIVVKNTETASFIMANGAKSQIDIGKLYSITLHRRNMYRERNYRKHLGISQEKSFPFSILPYLKNLVNSGEGISGYVEETAVPNFL